MEVILNAPISLYVFSLIEGMVFAGVVHLCIQCDLKKLHKWVSTALYSFIVIMVCNRLELVHLIKASIVFVLLIAFCYVVYRTKLYTLAFITFSVFYLNIMADLIVGNILSGLYRESIVVLLGTNSNIYLMSGIIVHIIQLAFAVLLVKHYRRTISFNPPKYWAQLDTALVISYYLAAVFLTINPPLQLMFNPFYIVLAITAFLVINALMIVLFTQMSKYHEADMRIVMAKAMTDKVDKEITNLRETHHDFTKIKHEWDNHLSTLSLLWLQGQQSEALEYLDSMALHIPALEFSEFTGDNTIDFIFNAKVALANKHKIAVEIATVPIQTDRIKPGDLVSIIANLLDNAIEAVCDLAEDERSIYVECTRVKEYVFIRIANPYRNEIITHGGSLATSKGNRLVHGYGLSIVSNICERYDGKLSIQYEGNTFVTTASIRT